MILVDRTLNYTINSDYLSIDLRKVKRIMLRSPRDNDECSRDTDQSTCIILEYLGVNVFLKMWSDQETKVRFIKLNTNIFNLFPIII